MLKEKIKSNKSAYRIARFAKYGLVRPVHLIIYTAERKFARKVLPKTDKDLALAKMHSRYKGKTAFIIGNGPSLKASDLEMIKKSGGYCFATNRIFLIFDQTDWRPDFYVAVDGAIVGDKTNTIEKIFKENIKYYFFAPDVFDHLPRDLKEKDNVIRFHKKRNNVIRSVDEFSPDPLEYLVDGYTATYPSIQLAYYLGFERIVVLGVDCNYSNIINADGSISKTSKKQQYFSKDYDSATTNAGNVVGMIEAYECARKFLETHGVKCINGTRGGELKVFERMSLEDVCLEVK